MSTRRFSALRAVLILATIAVAILGVATWSREVQDTKTAKIAALSADHQADPLTGVQRPSVLFVGDDFPAGYGEVGLNAYPFIVCNSIGLNCNVDAQAGTGFVNNGRDHLTGTSRLADRLPADNALYSVDVVVVDAGRNDIGSPVDVYAKAVEQYLSEVALLWPSARIVVIAPSFLSATPPPDYAARLAAINGIVAASGGTIIDPVNEGWYQGVDVSTLLRPDGLHPNQRGQEFIAGRLTRSLSNLGISQSGEAS